MSKVLSLTPKRVQFPTMSGYLRWHVSVPTYRGTLNIQLAIVDNSCKNLPYSGLPTENIVNNHARWHFYKEGYMRANVWYVERGILCEGGGVPYMQENRWVCEHSFGHSSSKFGVWASFFEWRYWCLRSATYYAHNLPPLPLCIPINLATSRIAFVCVSPPVRQRIT